VGGSTCATLLLLASCIGGCVVGSVDSGPREPIPIATRDDGRVSRPEPTLRVHPVGDLPGGSALESLPPGFCLLLREYPASPTLPLEARLAASRRLFEETHSLGRGGDESIELVGNSLLVIGSARLHRAVEAVLSRWRRIV